MEVSGSYFIQYSQVLVSILTIIATFKTIRHCAVADEVLGLIYLIGGADKPRKAIQYNIEANSWSDMPDSTLNEDTRDCAAAIIPYKDSMRRRIVVYGIWARRVNYVWLDPAGSWSTMEESHFHNEYMYAVSVSKYEHYIMGGKSNRHGDITTR